MAYVARSGYRFVCRWCWRISLPLAHVVHTSHTSSKLSQRGLHSGSTMPRSNERNFVFGQNNYQPPREGAHSRVSHIQTDPQGFKWNPEAARKCYIPQLERGTFNHVSLDFYATMRHELRELSPQNAPKLREAMRKRG